MPPSTRKKNLSSSLGHHTLERSMMRKKRHYSPKKLMNLSLSASTTKKRHKSASRSRSPMPLFGPTKYLIEEPELGVDRLKSLERGLAMQLRSAQFEIQSLKKKLESLVQDNKEEDELIGILREKIVIFQRALADKDVEVEKITDFVKQEKAELNRQRQVILDERKQNQSLIDEVEKKNSVLKQTIIERENEIEELQEKVAEWKRKYQDKNTEFIAAKKMYEKLNDKTEKSTEEIHSLKSEKSNLKNRLRKVQHSCNNIKTKYGLVDKQIEMLLKENRGLDQDKKDLQEVIDEYRQENEALQSNLEDILMKEIAQLQEENATLDDADKPQDLVEDPGKKQVFQTAKKFGFCGPELELQNDDQTIYRKLLKSDTYQTAVVNHVIESGFHSITFTMDELCDDSDIMIGVIPIDEIQLDQNIAREGWVMDLGDGSKIHLDDDSQYADLTNLKEGDQICVMFDVGKGTLSFSLNGIQLGVAFDNIKSDVGRYNVAVSMGAEGKYKVSLGELVK